MTQVCVRVARPEDAAALAHLVAGLRDHLEAAAPRDEEIAAQLPRLLGDPALEFACAWQEGEAVGFSQLRLLASVWSPPLEAFLEDLFVAPEARRHGVGRSLLRHALAQARAHGAARLALTTNEANAAAQALYRAEGLRPHAHPRYRGRREVLWSCRLPVAPGPSSSP